MSMFHKEICWNCMTGVMENGLCNRCGKPAENPARRDSNALTVGWSLQGGRYYLGKVLGSGGFGITYLAWDTKNNRRIAIKELYIREAVFRDRDTGSVQLKSTEYQEFYMHLRERFMMEAHLLNKMRGYSNIIDVYHLFEENNTVYYSMEFLEGRDLKSYFMRQNAPMSWEQLSPVILEVLEELKVLHSNGLFHRDISPDNIFILNDGRVRLIDFGSVRNYTFNTRFTTIYKPAFAPIEFQFTEGKQGPWSDIFSLSVSMYFLMTDRMPPNAPDRLATLKVNGSDPRVPISTIRSDLPWNVAEAIDKGMNLNAEDRQQDVNELYEELFPEKIFESDPVNSASVKPKPVKLESVSRHLMGTNGLYRGSKIVVSGQNPVRIGRGRDEDRGRTLDIVYPANYTNVSRKHCTLMVEQDGSLWIRDDASTNGVYINWNRITPNQWYQINRNDIVCLSNTEMYRVF